MMKRGWGIAGALMLCFTGLPVPAAHGGARVVYRSPLDGAAMVTTATNIIYRFSEPVDASAVGDANPFTVEGSRSGIHDADIHLSDDGVTLLIMPRKPFVPDETVNISVRGGIRLRSGESVVPPSGSFLTAAPPVQAKTSIQQIRDEMGFSSLLPAEENALLIPTEGDIRTVQDSIPIDFPSISTRIADSVCAGQLFVATVTATAGGTPYLMILNNKGFPVYSRRMPGNCFDFKRQPNGAISYFDAAAGCFYVLDTTGSTIDSYRCGNGYSTDLHELRLLDNGHALLLSYDYETMDMSRVVEGGNSSATVVGLILQELDHDKNVVFQWRSWDHYAITDATHEDLTAATIDYVHGNAIELDADSNIIVSCRHLDELTKIDRTTGDIIWRMGGKHNQFTFINDTIGFSHQHAIRRLPGGTFTLFDNGNFHTTPFSRAVEYRVDENAKTATQIWEFRHSPPVYGFAMGYVQRLPNGNTLIGWGAARPALTEVRPDGTVTFEMSFGPGIFSYRAYRFPWGDNDTSRTASVPASFRLHPNYPNPFNGHTAVMIDLPQETTLDADIFDVLGQNVLSVVRQLHRNAGSYYLDIDASTLTSGTYFFRLKTTSGVRVQKMLLLR
jgi:hypothetical protein